MAQHIGRWTQGSFPKDTGATHTVLYDQKHDAYRVESDEYDAFIEWVAVVWGEENDEQELGETNAEYLDRIGVSVKKL